MKDGTEKHIFHIHTNLSVCAKPESTFETYQEVAREQGLKNLALPIISGLIHMSKPAGAYIKARAHPFAVVCCPYGNRVLMEMMTDDEYCRVFDLTAEKGVAVEINLSGYPKNDHEKIIQHPSMRMFRIAKECGCQFVFGSDSHGIGGHNAYRNCAEFVTSVLELSENDIADFVK